MPFGSSLLAQLAWAICLPLACFVLLALGRRIGGYGRAPRFFIPDMAPGIYRSHPRFTELFFPASFGSKPVNFRLQKANPAGTYRVFVVGESATRKPRRAARNPRWSAA